MIEDTGATTAGATGAEPVLERWERCFEIVDVDFSTWQQINGRKLCLFNGVISLTCVHICTYVCIYVCVCLDVYRCVMRMLFDNVYIYIYIMIVCNMNHYIYIYIYIYNHKHIYIYKMSKSYIYIYTHGVHPFGKTNSKPAGYTIKPLIMHTCTTAYSYHNNKSHAYHSMSARDQ